ncbi:MAG: YggT family protein [Gallionella sp.]
MIVANILSFLLDVFVQGYAAVLFLRFILQWLRAPMRNPVGEMVMALTNFIVLRTRRYIPSAWQLDSASLLLALLCEMVYLAGLLWLQGFQFSLPALLVWSMVKLLIMGVYILIGALLIQAVLSWVNPHTPIGPVLNAMTHRFVHPIRRFVPLMGNIDFSTLILLVICQLILLAPLALLESWAVSLL